MRFTNAIKYLFAAAVLALTVAPGFADRAPTPEERTRIEAFLRQQGFTRWDDIELDEEDQVWEVDDAVGPDGREYDLKLDPGNLSIIERNRD